VAEEAQNTRMATIIGEALGNTMAPFLNQVNVAAANRGGIGGQPGRRDVPSFSGTSEGFMWLSFKQSFESFRLLAQLSEAESKLSLHSALRGTAAQLALGLGAHTAAFANATYDGYVLLLDNIFLPASEQSLLRQRFLNRKQGTDESVQAYGATKNSLFTQAYPGNMAADRLMLLLQEFSLGLANVEVLRATQNRQPPFGNLSEAINFASHAVATERNISVRNKSRNVAGLSTSMLNSDFNTANPATGGTASTVETPMDMSILIANMSMDPDLQHIVMDIFDDSGDEIGAMGGAAPFCCFRCNDVGHGYRSCTRPPGWRGGRTNHGTGGYCRGYSNRGQFRGRNAAGQFTPARQWPTASSGLLTTTTPSARSVGMRSTPMRLELTMNLLREMLKGLENNEVNSRPIINNQDFKLQY
jgi:hypothetical protein